MLAVTTFKTMEEALEIANDTPYGLGAGVWSRNGNLAYKMGRGSRPDAYGPTVITPTRRTRPLGAISSQASGVKRTK